MTTAVCLACGEIKHGAFTPFHLCHHDPTGTGLDREARALLLTDHYGSRDQLLAASPSLTTR